MKKYFFLIVWATLLLLLPNNKIEARSNNSSNLLTLAENKFKKIFPPEKKLLEKTEDGKESDFSDSNQVSKKTIRANLIEWLCTDRNAKKFITYKGIRVKGARIDEKLNLQYAKIQFPLNFIDSNFPMGINLEYAKILALTLSGSFTNEINADGLKVENTLFMDKGFKCNGKVSLIGATIGGDLNFGKGNFINPNGESFIADGLRVEHKVLMNNDFKSEGEVRFNGATIGITLDCSDAVFRNPNGYALLANGLRVDRSVYTPNNPEGIMMTKFESKGIVSLVDGTIDGILDCRNGSFDNPNGDAFIGTGLKIERSIHMEKAKFNGEVRLIGAKVGGDLKCDGPNTEFTNLNPNKKAFNAAGIEVHGDMNMANIKVSGEVVLAGAVISRKFIWTGVNLESNVILDLRSAKIGILQDDPNSWPDPNDPNGNLLSLCGLTYQDIYLTDANVRMSWLHAQDPTHFMPQPYEQLATVLHKHGYYEDAINIHIHKNDDWLQSILQSPQIHPLRKWGNRIWYFILKCTIGYGYRPWRAFWEGLVIIIIGTFFYKLGINCMIKTKEAKFPNPNDYPTFNSFLYSMDVFTPVIDLHQAKYRLPDPNRGNYSKLLRYFLWLQIVLGWIFITLFLTGLSGLVKI